MSKFIKYFSLEVWLDILAGLALVTMGIYVFAQEKLKLRGVLLVGDEERYFIGFIFIVLGVFFIWHSVKLQKRNTQENK